MFSFYYTFSYHFQSIKSVIQKKIHTLKYFFSIFKINSIVLKSLLCWDKYSLFYLSWYE